MPSYTACQKIRDISWAAQVLGSGLDEYMPLAVSHYTALAMSMQQQDSVNCRGAEIRSWLYWYSGEAWK